MRCYSLAVAALAGWTAVTPAAEEPAKKARPKVEVVFCLDTTGSMGGLIEGAKQKIWAICNQIASGKPTPDLRVGLVAYRDKGDAYVTKVFDLSADLDAVYGHLKGFQAQGGGDGPESVNQALAESVSKITWGTDKGTLRIIFLVGDAPPHMDYRDDQKYADTCQDAVKKDIIINTIQCGNNAECTRFWKDICARAEGSFVGIPQDGGAVVIATPFDGRLAEINGLLARSTLCWGAPEKQMRDQAKNLDATRLEGEAASARIAYQAKNAQVAAYDLLDNIRQGKVKLESLKEEELPQELRKLRPGERKAHLDKLEKQRKELLAEVADLDKKRTAFVAKKQAELAGKGAAGFDQQVLVILRAQCAKNGISY